MFSTSVNTSTPALLISVSSPPKAAAASSIAASMP
jgi:hypothetical protein